ncbi:o-succinylbenzoate synthase [Sungkyunkwania multivorans]|uniref:o-succinylbenzoate synthase n=1 Tax=Sungkyunkwania multivorans TaxID=1173618 RepID=A0ABW3CWV9_9FLAO
MKASYQKYVLHFKRPSGTSRGILTQKETWFIVLREKGKIGIGECGVLRGLSIDDRSDYKERLQWTCDHIMQDPFLLRHELREFPSIQFGLEQALMSLKSEDPFLLFPSEFTKGVAQIPINGLVWMGDEMFMKEQIRQKIHDGFNCIKMKIGAIDFDAEIKLLKSIREEFSSKDIEIRVDANGAFGFDEALDKLKRLAELHIHSIEQPIKQGNYSEMARLCQQTPIPIALDEELIGIFGVTEKQEMLQTIRPQYIILKPSLIGGYAGSEEWIHLAEENGIGWWVTSALESNIGLNAIAQWTYTLKNNMPQGLGTGGLFTNNISSPLEVARGTLKYNRNLDWNINLI